MKKLVLLLAVAFSVSLFSCGGGKTEAGAADSTAQDSAAAKVDSTAKDSVAQDSTPAPVDSIAKDSLAK